MEEWNEKERERGIKRNPREEFDVERKHPQLRLHLWSNCGQMTASQSVIFPGRGEGKRKKKKKRERGERDCRSPSQITHIS